ncbi:MAG: pseudouridine-5'-phosphate glycosidase [Candidatus Cloacimonetes bacterium]|nr:pseudouridine-5'-phosphate glycosidase [Candidatus Cloacimonadota bacterium]MCF7814314.1 pseudouridine-5'-phosphate glycosidase [Candidatus Cloacimonadota bacterium]MCF7868391.1 pseudouridine-5'-phosphate glycosidase [Candidatus Cloacimonadota bacterium]MCF7883844.1 pseudouridine-5'-phosphate glycosidase [Candidatus Cloacimonadota bacterium]
MNKNLSKYIQLSPSVAEAINHRKPIVALESTIISHGMPYPENLKVAEKLENIASQLEVVPATICIIDGKIKVGLDGDELEILAKADNVAKVSSRDISRILAENRTGATTVASTMRIAAICGIKVFATGGIGGVHRNAESTFDISNDLIEFSRNPVIVVSAGAKAILDLPKTLEYLETMGVPVFGYKTDKFPAFYSSESDLKVDEITSIEKIAKAFKTSLQLGFKTGVLIANPIPKEHEIPFEEMDKIIQKALINAENNGISGRELTPFLLSNIVKLTEGKSLKTNIELVRNNVKLACEIAKEIMK